MELKFNAELWEWQGKGAWCFFSLPKEYYDEIKVVSSSPNRGFGSVKVDANIGKTAWRTSIFPDTKSGTYLLPVKKAIRIAENLNTGSVVGVRVRLIDY
jgi:Domain of unknown function (DUF1905)